MRNLINASPYRLSIPGGPVVVDRGATFRVDPEPLRAWLEGPVGRACVEQGWIVGGNGAALTDAAAVKAYAAGDTEGVTPPETLPDETLDETSGPVVRASYAEIEAETDLDRLAHWLTGSNLSDKKRAAIIARLEALEGEG